MRRTLAIMVGVISVGVNVPVTAAPPLWQNLETTPAATLGKPVPAASLGLPRSVTDPLKRAPHEPIIRSVAPDPLVGEYSPAARFGPASEIRPVGSGASASLDPIDTPEEPYNWGIPSNLTTTRTRPAKAHSTDKFGEKFHDWFGGNGDGGGGGQFPACDHSFDNFISPLTSPFYAEDPRSLTEIRPIFIYQTIPKNQTTFQGGNLEVFALQGRLAITERFSIVLHKLGVISFNPGNGSLVSGGTGLTEINIGPKYTFYRNEQSGTIAAAGVQFQLPIGTSKAFQDTGTLSVVPYASVAQKFWRTSYGEMAFMSTLAYSFSTNTQRSDFLYSNLHLDYDIANLGKFYPVLEMNWYHYTTNGQASALGIEGHDLANVGSAVSGRNFLSIAPGFRYKFSEHWQAGIFTEFPLLGTKDIQKFRVGFDLIWRY